MGQNGAHTLRSPDHHKDNRETNERRHRQRQSHRGRRKTTPPKIPRHRNTTLRNDKWANRPRGTSYSPKAEHDPNQTKIPSSKSHHAGNNKRRCGKNGTGRVNRKVTEPVEFTGGDRQKEKRRPSVLHRLPPRKRSHRTRCVSLPQITATLDKLRGAKYLSTRFKKWILAGPPNPRKPINHSIYRPGEGALPIQGNVLRQRHSNVYYDNILGLELKPHVFVYLDDIIVINTTLDDHLNTLCEVFRRLRDARLKINTKKCKFCMNQLVYLGHIVD